MIDEEYYKKIKDQYDNPHKRPTVRAKKVFSWLERNGWEVTVRKEFRTIGRKVGRIYVGTPRTETSLCYSAKKDGYWVTHNTDTHTMNSLCCAVVMFYKKRLTTD